MANENWDNEKYFSIYQAACLWLGKEPDIDFSQIGLPGRGTLRSDMQERLGDLFELDLHRTKPITDPDVKNVVRVITDAIYEEAIAADIFISSDSIGNIGVDPYVTLVERNELKRLTQSLDEKPEFLFPRMPHDRKLPTDSDIGQAEESSKQLTHLEKENERLRAKVKETGKHYAQTRNRVLSAALRLINEHPDKVIRKSGKIVASLLAEEINDNRSYYKLDDSNPAFSGILDIVRSSISGSLIEK